AALRRGRFRGLGDGPALRRPPSGPGERIFSIPAERRARESGHTLSTARPVARSSALVNPGSGPYAVGLPSRVSDQGSVPGLIRNRVMPKLPRPLSGVFVSSLLAALLGGSDTSAQGVKKGERLADYFGFQPLEIYKLEHRIGSLTLRDLD